MSAMGAGREESGGVDCMTCTSYAGMSETSGIGRYTALGSPENWPQKINEEIGRCDEQKYIFIEPVVKPDHGIYIVICANILCLANDE